MPLTPQHRAGRSLPLLLAALCCLPALAGCGASSPAKNTASSARAQGIRFATCVRSHGIPNFPNPSTSAAGKIIVGNGSGINPSTPAYQAAQSICRRLLPGSGPEPGNPSAATESRMLAISTCMRAHRISGFPDPTVTPPTSPTGYSAVLATHGTFFAIPTSIEMNAPAFKQAATACRFGPSRGH